MAWPSGCIGHPLGVLELAAGRDHGADVEGLEFEEARVAAGA